MGPHKQGSEHSDGVHNSCKQAVIQTIQYKGDGQLFEWYLMTTRLQDNINLASLTDTAKRFSFRLEHTRGQDRNLTHKTLLHG